MTDNVTLTQAEKPRYLLMKRDLYYGPNDCGYTGIKDKAGRYFETDALPDCGVTAIHEDDAPEFSKACFDDLARDHLQEKVAAQAAEIERLYTLAKANNDLARHEAGGRRKMQDEIARLAGLVRRAFEEGYSAGTGSACPGGPILWEDNLESDWAEFMSTHAQPDDQGVGK